MEQAMTSTLEKIRKLEHYIATGGPSQDRVLDMALEKLLSREMDRLSETRERLQTQISEFEQTYHLHSTEFSKQFAQGELGDDIDFIEWASTLEMIANLDHRLSMLKVE
jgi:septation ring formation regulator EzrA